MESQEKALGKQFRKQLAACVRSIQWSYAIFWSLSTSQEGMLDWNDGFYNGDIKTRKTTQLTDCKEDQMGLQRSEHLRELYESLSTVESNEQNRRPSASLSPEDLTDTEWYYMICMSFTFPLGQDLPGKVYELNEPVWLSNAQFAEKRSFSRCLLAKSACIQTIVGLPFMDGVLEIGTSELVLEDPGFVQTIRSSFWDFQDPVSTEHSTSSSPLIGKEDENMCTILDHEVDEAVLLENHLLAVENDSHEFRFDVNSYAPSKQTELMHSSATELHSSICDKFAGTPVGLSSELSNGLPGSFKCSDECAPWPFAQNILPSPRGERVKGNMLDHHQESNQANFSSFGADGDGSHYASTLSTILGSSKQQMTSPIIPFKNCSDKYSFKTWKRGSRNLKIFCRMPQRMLKKLLIDCKWMNGDQVLKPQEEVFSRNKTWKSEAEDTNANHVLSERRRREKLNEKFLVLRSLVPSISKVDKTSILADTIEYIKELERRVEELESYGEEVSLETKPTRRHPDIAERTSDNYGENDGRRPWSSSKRKACEIDETDDDHQRPLPKNGLVDINITVIEKAVLIEMQCPWRDSLLLDIVETMSKLHLDAQSVQSSSIDGTLAITLRSKCMAEVVASPGMIKRALQRVVSRC